MQIFRERIAPLCPGSACWIHKYATTKRCLKNTAHPGFACKDWLKLKCNGENSVAISMTLLLPRKLYIKRLKLRAQALVHF